MLIVAGFLLLALGVALWAFPRLLQNMPRLLPGDILIKRPGMVVYFPIVSTILLSLLLSFFFWLIRR